MSRVGQCKVCGEVRKLPASHNSCYPCAYKARKARVQNRCKNCNKLISLRTEKQLCKSCVKRGEGHHSWKGGTRNNAGYRLLHIPDHPNAQKGGYIMEHVLVMSQFLGRPLTKDENVHHKNGVRDDNRIENLELWTRSQPAGQRVADKVAWAKEILALYGSDFDRGETPPVPDPDRNAAAKALSEAVGELLGLAERLDSLADKVT